MKIIYNRRGQIIDIVGFVNYYNQGNNYNYGGNGHGNGNGYGNGNNNNYDSDDDFYYYRKDGTKAKMEADDVKEIKRETVEIKRK